MSTLSTGRNRLTTGKHPSKAAAYAACYTLWAMVIALAYATFSVCASSLRLVVPLLMPDADMARSWIILGGLAVGLAVFVVVMAAEPYLRAGVTARRGDGLTKRFVKITLPLVAACVLAEGVRFLVLATL